jgi:DNA-binding MarR family transcriptional regulator
MTEQQEESIYAIFGQVVRLHYSRAYLSLEKVGIFPGQAPLLFILGKQDGLSQKELADKLFIKAATATVMLKRMQYSGLVERHIDEKDQRVIRVFLTEKGRQTLEVTRKIFKEIGSQCFKNFSPEEQLLLRRLFMQMRENLQTIS